MVGETRSRLDQVFKPDIGTSISRGICTCSVPLLGRAVAVRGIKSRQEHAQLPGVVRLCDK